MKSSLGMLSGLLVALTMGMSAFGGLDEAAAFGSQANQRVAVILVGANGSDTVGRLMPLSLWPPVRSHKEQCQRNHRGRVACIDRAALSSGAQNSVRVQR
jgi:hypothetical protein